MSVVELRGVAKSFGSVAAVRGIDLVVEEGSFVTLLGPSGCGKTTILRMIAGLTPPDAGDILIRDRRVNDVPIHRRNLGVVLLEPEAAIAVSKAMAYPTVLDPTRFKLPEEITSLAGFDPTGKFTTVTFEDPIYWSKNALEWQRQFQRIVTR